MRTTSSLESLNAELRRSFPDHPHIFRFVECLQVLEFSKWLDMDELVQANISSKQFEKRKKADKKREEKIQRLTTALETDADMSPGLFLEAMATDENTRFEIPEFSNYSLNHLINLSLIYIS